MPHRKLLSPNELREDKVKSIEKLKGNLQETKNVQVASAVAIGITLLLAAAPYISDPQSSPYGLQALINSMNNPTTFADLIKQDSIIKSAILESAILSASTYRRFKLGDQIEKFKKDLSRITTISSKDHDDR